MSRASRSTAFWLAGLTLLAVGLRLAVVAWVQHRDPALALTNDSNSYLSPAKALVREHLYKRSPGTAGPELLRTPGYPLLIAGVYKVFGERQAVLLASQATLSAAVVPLTFAVARRLTSVRAALIAAAIVAAEPSLVTAPAMVMSEWLSALTILVVAYTGVRFFDPRDAWRPGWAAALGASIALATMVRPTTYYLPVVVAALAGALVVHRRPRPKTGKVAAAAACFVLPLVLVLGGWQWRNHEVTGTWRFSSIDAVNLFRIRGPVALSADDGITLQQAKDRLAADVPRVEGETVGAYADRTFTRGLREVLAHPAIFATQSARGAVREVFTIGGTTPFRLSPVGATVLLVAYVMLYASALYGAWRLLRTREHTAQHLFVILLVGYVLAVSALGAGLDTGPRFRVPVIALVCIYAAAGVDQLTTLVGARRHKPSGEPPGEAYQRPAPSRSVDQVVEDPGLLAALGTARQAEVLEMRVGLALGH